MELNTRQLCLIAGGVFPLTKLILLPSALSAYAGRDLWAPALVLFAAQAIVIWAVLFLSSKTDMTFYELTKRTIGTVGARILFGLYALYFLLSSLLPVLEQNLLLRSAFYDTVPSLLISGTFYVLALYFCAKPLRCLGRCADVAVPLSLFALVALIGLSLSSADFGALSPALQSSPRTLLTAGSHALPRFAECAYPLFFLGRFRYEKGLALKVTLSYLAGAALTLFFLCDFFAVYSVLSPRQSSAISKIGRYFSGIDTIGRIDLLFVYLLSFGMLFAILLPVRLSTECLRIACGAKDNAPPFYLGVNLALLALNAVFYYAIPEAEALLSRYLFPLFLLFAYLLPPLAWALRRRHA